MTLDGPYDSFCESKAELKKALMTFIAETQTISKAAMASEPWVTRSGRTYFLRKVDSHENAVAIATMGGNEGWEFDVLALSSLVRHAIASKAEKLWAVPHPWILLLLDRHHLATVREYASVRDQLGCPGFDSSHLQKFDSVYIINDQKDVFRLHPLADDAGIVETLAQPYVVAVKQ